MLAAIKRIFTDDSVESGGVSKVEHDEQKDFIFSEDILIDFKTMRVVSVEYTYDPEYGDFKTIVGYLDNDHKVNDYFYYTSIETHRALLNNFKTYMENK